MRRYLVLVPLALAGCGGSSSTDAGGAAAPAAAAAPKLVEFKPNVDAGVPVAQSADTEAIKKLASRSNFGRRADPFALDRTERLYETQQSGARIFQDTGGFTLEYTPPEEKTEIPVTEPQPYRRLAGIVVGESVVAIIDMGDGRTEIVRPGQKIPGTEWTVASLDEEKAVLTRGGNVLPKRIIVRLESPPAGMGQPAGGGFDGGGAGAGGAPGVLGPPPMGGGGDR